MDISSYDNIITERTKRPAFGGIIIGVLLSTILWAVIALVLKFIVGL